MRFGARGRLQLTVRLDAVAALRAGGSGTSPDPLEAALLAEMAGADGILVHFTSDERSISERDVHLLAAITKGRLTVACAERAVDKVLASAPDRLLLVPEKAQDWFAHGGVNVVAEGKRCAALFQRLRAADVEPMVLVDADEEQVRAARDVGARGVLINCAGYTDGAAGVAEGELIRIEQAISAAVEKELSTAIGIGLDRRNIYDVATIPELDEVVVGHSIIARAIIVGIEAAVHEVLDELPRLGEEL